MQKGMKMAGIDAYIIPSADPHQSEYPPEYWSGRSWISGFTGSAGTVIVTTEHAGLWTDSRYYLQAEIQLKGSGVQLHKLIAQSQAEYIDWLCQNLKKGAIVGCDFWCFSLAQVQAFDRMLGDKGILLKDCGDLLTTIWKNRPGYSTEMVYEHPVKYAGKTREAKLKWIREEMKKAGADYFLVSALDEISYLLNLRGRDVHCNPVFMAYLLVDTKEAQLFLPNGKIPESLNKKLNQAGVYQNGYEQVSTVLGQMKDGVRVMMDQSSLNAKLAFRLPANSILNVTSPVMLLKATKNSVEINHIRNVMEKDGVALVKAFMWLENSLKKSKRVTEFEFAQQLEHFRSNQENYIGESFDAIVGYAANGAIIHYRPEKESSAVIKPKGILLVDSGGQYMDGTTDITRTIALSKPSPVIKQEFTAVLMGHIALAAAVFPEKTKGIQLDVLARQYLWKLAKNYSHGTGHGVGFFMNVHEPPQGFVTAWNQRGQSEMLAGMLTSNEPGFYKKSNYGIRIENLVLNVPYKEAPDGKFLKFETVTLFPIDTSLIDQPMMTRETIDWLNNYHKEVYKRLSPYLNQDEKKWLKKKCNKI